MCMELYIGVRGADVDLTLQNSPSGLWIKPVPPEHHSRPLIELESVFEVGSFMGCTCGLIFGEWSRKNPDEEHDRRLENVAALREVLAANAGDIVRLMTLEEFRYGALEEFPRRVLDLDAMREDCAEFSLREDCVYEIWPPGTLGPARVTELFEPRRLKAEEIQGTAPELFAYREDFSGKGWDELPPEKYQWHDDVFNLMDMETLQHFLPGYLMQAMEPAGSALRWSIQCFSARENFKVLYDLLNPPQRSFFIGVVDFLMRCEDVNNEARDAYVRTRQSCLTSES